MTQRLGPAREKLVLVLIGAGLLIFGTISWFIALGPPALSNPDAVDYAQMGREIRRGHGFATLQTFPRHIPYLAENGHLEQDHWPNLYRYPVTPLLVAGVLFFVDDPAWAAVIQSGVWYLLATPLIFLLAARFTNPGVAAVCTLLYLADADVRVSGYSGLTESLAIFLTAAFFLLAYRPTNAGWKWLCLGGVCGLAYLTRTQMIVLLPIALGYAWTLGQGRRRRKALVLVLAGGVVVASPWLVRNAIVTGSPTFSFSTSRNLLRHTPAYDFEVEKDLHVPVYMGEIIKTHGKDIAAKVGGNLIEIVRPAFWARALGTGLAVAFALFLLAWLLQVVIAARAPEDPQLTWFRRAMVILVAATFLVAAIAFHKTRFYDPLRPFILIVVCIEAWDLLCRWKPVRAHRTVRGVVLTAAVVIGITSSVLTTRSRAALHARISPAETLQRRAYAELATLVPADAVVVSSASPRVALYADRRSIRLPQDPAQLGEIAEKYVDYQYLLLTRRRGLTGDAPWPFATSPQYAEFTRSEEFRRRFQRVARLANGAVLYQRK